MANPDIQRRMHRIVRRSGLRPERALAVHEHDKKFWLSVAEMHRVLRPGGVICVPGPRTIGHGFKPMNWRQCETRTARRKVAALRRRAAVRTRLRRVSK